jgi:hypothetical protein
MCTQYAGLYNVNNHIQNSVQVISSNSYKQVKMPSHGSITKTSQSKYIVACNIWLENKDNIY